MEINAFERQISKITVRADLKYLRPVLEFVRFCAEGEGLSPNTAVLLEVAVEEACVNVIQHAYSPAEDEYFDVSISRGPQRIIISIEDRGVPTDLEALDKNKNNGLGVMLIKSIADEVVFQNLGEYGKRVKIIKNLPGACGEKTDMEKYALADDALQANVSGGEASKIPQAAIIKESRALKQPEIRFMQTGEAFKLSRCIYHVYGYTYGSTFYYPEKIAEMIDSKILKSIVAVDENGDIVAHLGMKFPFPGAKIAESAQAAVMPQYRGMHIFESMKKFSADYAEKNGLYGLYSEAVTLHPFTQKGNIALGAKETGIILAFIPEIAFFKKIQNEGEKRQRHAAMLFYMKTGEGPERLTYAPPRHEPIIKSIYEYNGLKRTFISPKETNDKTRGETRTEIQAEIGRGTAESASRSSIEVNFNAYLNAALILVNSIGADFGGAMKTYKRQLCEKRTDCIYAYIPLADPGAPAASDELEKLKFSFAGIIPEYFNGDCALYQFLNSVPTDPAKICAVSDFAKTLLEYITKEYETSLNL